VGTFSDGIGEVGWVEVVGSTAAEEGERRGGGTAVTTGGGEAEVASSGVDAGG
jgi:hypothetical protein